MPSTILVADDEAGIVSLTKTILEREGHLVTTASDGEETLRKAEDDNMSLAGLRCLSHSRYVYFPRPPAIDVDYASWSSVYEARGDVNGQ